MAGGGGSHISRSLLILQESNESQHPCEPRHREQNNVNTINKVHSLIVTCNNISSCSAATPVIDALEGLFTGQQYVGQWEADIHCALTLSYALFLELPHLLWVSWNHHLRNEEEQRGSWFFDDLDWLLKQGCVLFVS